jgi:hypothetical protein
VIDLAGPTVGADILSVFSAGGANRVFYLSVPSEYPLNPPMNLPPTVRPTAVSLRLGRVIERPRYAEPAAGDDDALPIEFAEGDQILG